MGSRNEDPLPNKSPDEGLPGGEDLDDKGEWQAGPPVAELRHRPNNPRAKYKYNPFCRLFYLWLDPLFCVGLRRGLNQSDLYAHASETDSEMLLKKFNKYWTAELARKERGLSSRLWLAIVKCIWWRMILQGIIQAIEVGLLVGQSVVLGYLTEYFSIQDPTSQETRDAYLLAASLVMMALVIMMLHSHGFLLGQKVGMMARIICTSAIYQKVLSLSQVTLRDVSTGHVINLASNDVQRFDLAFLFLHFLWISPIHLAVFTYLVYVEVGWPAFLATAFVILQIPLQIFLAKVFAKLRFKSAAVTDQRVKVMNEVITGIRVIKMYAWEHAFKKVVTKLRRKESTLVLKVMLVSAINFAQYMMTFVVLPWSTFTAHGGIGRQPALRSVFVLLSLRQPLLYFAVLVVMESMVYIAAGRVAIIRIKEGVQCYQTREGSPGC